MSEGHLRQVQIHEEPTSFPGAILLVSNDQLAAKIRLLTKRRGLGEKKMFGGLAFFVKGNMCFGIVKDDLMVRVGPDLYEKALSRPHARPMDFSGKPMKGFVFVSSEGWRDNRKLQGWLEDGMKYASSLPPKK